jgi:hypothetical protein
MDLKKAFKNGVYFEIKIEYFTLWKGQNMYSTSTIFEPH